MQMGAVEQLVLSPVDFTRNANPITVKIMTQRKQELHQKTDDVIGKQYNNKKPQVSQKKVQIKQNITRFTRKHNNCIIIAKATRRKPYKDCKHNKLENAS